MLGVVSAEVAEIIYFVISAVTNSVINGKSEPIQVQVTDIEKCFDKMWPQSCVNSLYEAGLRNDMLNLLYIENKNARLQLKPANICPNEFR